VASEVRRAEPDDAPALVRTHLACWRQAYSHLLSEHFLATREADAARRAQVWRDAIARGGGPWVAVDDGDVVGLSLAVDPDAPGRARLDSHLAEDQPPGLELAMLYLLESHHGSGLGQRLLDAAVGAGAAFLWVAEDNPRARAFYARNGFRWDGLRRTEPSFEDMAVVRLVRP
jgi:ribosomal protein S18 acetylase RimI-like enzyme